MINVLIHFAAIIIVISSIMFAVVWGGIYIEPFDFVKSAISWTAIWASMEIFAWSRKQ